MPFVARPDQLGDLRPGADPRSDAELIAAVRNGDQAAYGPLWARHEPAARSLARQIGSQKDADDLVSESFYRVLRAISAGGGPDGPFRPYLLSTLRRINIDLGRSYYRRVVLTGDTDDLDTGVSDGAELVALDRSEQSAAWRAWASLPEDAQTLLWHLVIEEETPAQLAPILGTTPNGVASRALRARERLRRAFLEQHLQAADQPECDRARRRMGRYLRTASSGTDQRAIDDHIARCSECFAAFAELTDLNKSLRLLVAPVALGGAVVSGRLAGLFGRATHSGTHVLRQPLAAVGIAAATVATVVGVAALTAGHRGAPSADPAPRHAVQVIATPTSSAAVPTAEVSHPSVSVPPRAGSPTVTQPLPARTTPTSQPATEHTEQTALATHATRATSSPTSALAPAPTVSPAALAPPSSSSTEPSLTITKGFGIVSSSHSLTSISVSMGWTIVSVLGPPDAHCTIEAVNLAICVDLYSFRRPHRYFVQAVAAYTTSNPLRVWIS